MPVIQEDRKNNGDAAGELAGGANFVTLVIGTHNTEKVRLTIVTDQVGTIELFSGSTIAGVEETVLSSAIAIGTSVLEFVVYGNHSKLKYTNGATPNASDALKVGWKYESKR